MPFGWPPVLNVVGILYWLLGMLKAQAWRRCHASVSCYLKDFPPVLAEHPGRLLPALSEIGVEESRVRLNYWGGAILTSPVIMAILCETTRLMFFSAKLALFGKPVPEPKDIGTVSTDKLHPFQNNPWIVVGMVLYHAACAGMVACAIPNGWISSHHGGQYAWELWALWQQLCLWTLFAQTLARCVMLDASALSLCTVKAVLLYTAPGVSEITDTMKDWVVTGVFCTLPGSTWGLVLAIALVLLDGLLQHYHIGFNFRVTGSIVVNPPLVPLFVLWVVLVPLFSVVRVPTALLTDGWLLAVVSAYVIIFSYVRVSLYAEPAREIKKSYYAVLCLPPPKTSSEEGCCAWAARQAITLWEDLLSSSRLIIAWVEDIPQGLLGMMFITTYTLPKEGVASLGFAGVSALISICKGVLIPYFQDGMFERRRQGVQKEFEMWETSDEAKPAALARFLGCTASPTDAGFIDRDNARGMLQSHLINYSEQVLQKFGVHDREIFAPIKLDRDAWVQTVLFKEDLGLDALKHLYKIHLERGAGEAALIASGYGREAGLTASRCKEKKYTCMQCRNSGYSAAHCKEAGYSCAECKNAGYSCRECVQAGYMEQECRLAGFDERELQFVLGREKPDNGEADNRLCNLTLVLEKLSQLLGLDSEDKYTVAVAAQRLSLWFRKPARHRY